MEDWKKYETLIFQKMKGIFPASNFEYDKSILGKYSNTIRQVDILITQKISNIEIKIAVECKYYNKVIDLKIIESFISMLRDLNVTKGIIITNKGFSKAAEQRAFNDESDLELDIYNFENINDVQCDIVANFFPFLEFSFVTEPPFGFIVDQRKGFVYPYLCFYFLRGLNIEQAFKREEWIDVSFFPKKGIRFTVDELIEEDNSHSKERYSNLVISQQSFLFRGNILNTGIRLQMPTLIIYKFIVEIEHAILAFNLYTRPQWEIKNLRKLEFIVNTFNCKKITSQELKVLEQAFGKLNSTGSYNIMLERSKKEI